MAYLALINNHMARRSVARKRVGGDLTSSETSEGAPLNGSSMSNYDVVIVGYGPVGAFAANLLANYGARVLILERETTTYAVPRAVAMDDETVRLFGLVSPDFPGWLRRHLYDAPIDLRTGPPPEAVACLSPAGSSATSHERAEAQFRPGWSIVGPLPPRTIEESGGGAEFAFVHQPTVERRLRDRLANGCGGRVSVRLGVEVTSVTQQDTKLGSSVTVVCRDISTGAVTEHGGAYVIGADGGSSGVRKGLGIPFGGSSFADEPWLVIDCESDDPAIAAAYPCFNFMNAWDSSIGAVRCVVHVPLPGPRAARRFEFLLERGEDPATMTSPERVAGLLASVGVHPSRVSVVRCTVYTFHARQAAQWVAGRVVLAGDAAHCMPPFRGQGMCAGLRDASNVCWKIATLLRREKAGSGAGSSADSELTQSLLRTYRAERWPHLQATTDIAVSIGSLVQMRRPAVLRHARNVLMGGLYRFPLTRPFFMEPFAPPSALHEGFFDFRGPSGEATREAGGGLARQLAAALSLGLKDAFWPLLPSPGPQPLPGWRARDAAAGKSVPNYAIELLNDGAARRIALDELLQPGAADEQQQQQLQGADLESRAPLWSVLVSPRFSASVRRGGEREVDHPLCTLGALRSTALNGGGDPNSVRGVLSATVGVQLLPVTAAPSRIAAHALATLAQVSGDNRHKGLPANGSAGGGRGATKNPQPSVRFPTAVAAFIRSAYRGIAAWAASQQQHDGGSGATAFGGPLYQRASLQPPEPNSWEACADVAAADSTGKLARWFDALGADAVIVRPDRLVYGAYSACELREALQALQAAFDGDTARAFPGPPNLRVRSRRSLAADYLRWALAWAIWVCTILFVWAAATK